MAICTESLRSAFRHTLLWACAVALSATSGAPVALAQNQLPALGDSVSEGFGVGVERKLGDAIMREIRRDPDYLDDPVLLDYLQSIWQPLVETARQRGEISADTSERYAWEAFLVRDRSVNAFALPGGFVGVHLGLIAMTGSADELASVLAHELSHVTQRHIARGIENSKRQSLLSAAAMIVGVLAASKSSRGDAANAVITGGQAAAIQGELNFSRDMEREADRIGFGLLTGAGFAPAGMAAMFEKLDQASRLNDSGGYPYLRSHPLTTERIGAARARLSTAPRVAPVRLLEHALAQSRARVLDGHQGPGLATLAEPRSGSQAAQRRCLTRRCGDGRCFGRCPFKCSRVDPAARLGSRRCRTGQAAQLLRSAEPDDGGRAEASLAMLVAQSQLERGNAAAAARCWLACRSATPTDDRRCCCRRRLPWPERAER